MSAKLLTHKLLVQGIYYPLSCSLGTKCHLSDFSVHTLKTQSNATVLLFLPSKYFLYDFFPIRS